VQIDCRRLILARPAHPGLVGRHMFRTWTMQRLSERGKLDPRPVITHRYRLSEFGEAFGALTSGSTNVGKSGDDSVGVPVSNPRFGAGRVWMC